MKILKNTIPLHKLYGFLLLNTSLIVFIPILLVITRMRELNELTSIPFEVAVSLILSSGGVILSILFIMRKKVAIYLLTFLLIFTIIIMLGFMIYTLFDMRYPSASQIIFTLNGFGFFIVEGILGLLIIHSKKLSDEFDQYN